MKTDKEIRAVAISFNAQQKVLKDVTISSSDLKEVLKASFLPTNNNFLTVFRKSGIIKQISKGYYQILSNITIKGVTELYRRYSLYNRRFV